MEHAYVRYDATGLPPSASFARAVRICVFVTGPATVSIGLLVKGGLNFFYISLDSHARGTNEHVMLHKRICLWVH